MLRLCRRLLAVLRARHGAPAPGLRLVKPEDVGVPGSTDVPVIPAACYSDDRLVEVQFDALPWLEQADDEEVLALAACGWGSDYPADRVAEWFQGHNADIAHVQSVQGVPEAEDASGFECHIDGEAARDWLRTHRPRLAARITPGQGPGAA